MRHWNQRKRALPSLETGLSYTCGSTNHFEVYHFRIDFKIGCEVSIFWEATPFLSSAWLCQQGYCRGAASVVRTLRSLRNRCTDPGKIQTTIFSFFTFFKFQIYFFFFFVNMGPLWGQKKFHTKPLLHFFIRAEPNFMINKVVLREYKSMYILAICQKLNILWHFEIVTWESMWKS